MYYKWLGLERNSCNGGAGQWLPPGEWMPEVAVDPCRSGYHVCRRADVVRWDGRELWEVEGAGDGIIATEKIVFPRARLVRLVADARAVVLWGCRCAEDVLPIYEAAYPGDSRPRDAIAATRAWVENPCGATVAARAAACDAVRDAVYAARAAAWAAACDAACDASWAAAWDAASAAARAAACDASWAAARAAAWAAASAAACDAVRDAAGAAAWAAAWDAAVEKYTAWLLGEKGGE